MLRRTCQVHNLLFTSSGTSQFIDYQTIWRYQKALLEHIGQARKAGHPVDDVLIVVQHPSVYTLGRGATVNNLKFVPNNAMDSPNKVHRIERGGEVTWHGPGQVRNTQSLSPTITLQLTISSLQLYLCLTRWFAIHY